MALTFLLYLPDSVTYVMYPRLLHTYGESGRQAAAIRPPVERTLQATSVLVPFLCGLAFLFAPAGGEPRAAQVRCRGSARCACSASGRWRSRSRTSRRS